MTGKTSLQLCALAAVLFSAHLVLSQVTTGTISGTVRDSSGGVVPGSHITIKNSETGVSRMLVSDNGGRYNAPQLGLGHYEVMVEAPGFQNMTRSGIELTVGREAVVDFALQVGSVAEQVTVTGEAPLVESTNATVGSLVSEKTMRDIPLNGRSFTDLTAIQPGVVPNLGIPSGVFQGAGRIVVNGARPQQSLYLLDGIEITDLHSNTPPASVLGQTLGVDTIQEFNLLQTNYGAQFGRAVGGVINAVSRSGTNSFHGNAFEFLRNSKLDAKNFFDNASAPIPPFRRNQFGGTVGGPIVKDKAFFFFSYEGLRQSLATSDVGFTLTPETQLGQITGCPPGLTSCSPSQRIVSRTVTVDPNIVPLFKILPAGNGNYFNNGLQQVIGSRTQGGSENYFMGRVDEHPTGNDNIFGRVVFDHSSSSLPDAQFFPDGSGRHTSTDAHGGYDFAELAWTRILSPTLLNTARFGFTRNNNQQCMCVQGTNIDVEDRQWIGKIPAQFQIIPGVPFAGPLGIPGVALPGGHNGPGNTTNGADLDDPIHFIDNTFTYSDSFQVTRGRHSFDIGGDVRRFQENALQSVWARGNITWATIQNFLSSGTCGTGCTGFPGINVITTTGVTGPPDVYRAFRQTYGSWYVQDDFRLRTNLILNLGIRWEKLSGPVEVNGKAATFKNIISDVNWTQLGDKPLFDSPSGVLHGFTPRVGLAYSFDQKTSVRVGFGIFQEMPVEYSWGLTIYYPPYSDRLNIRTASQWPSPLAGVDPNSPAVLSTRQPVVVDPNLKYPYALQYNLGIERQIGQNWVAKVAFVGNRGIDLVVVNNPIQPVPARDANGQVFTPLRAPAVNPNLDSTRYYTNTGDSRYSALQFHLERRFSNGLQIGTSYTWANNIGDAPLGLEGGQEPLAGGATAGFQTGNAWDYKHYDKGRLQQDVRQNFTLNYNYELPVGNGKAFGSGMSNIAENVFGGWQLNGIVTARTGLAVDISGPGYNSTIYCNTCTVRPNLKPGASNNPVLGDPSLWFNPAAFTTVTPGYYGNLGHNTLTGPRAVDVDFSLFKHFAITENRRLQFRAEFFNLLNHPVFRAPGSTVFNTDGTLNPTVGVITTTATTSRQIQFALKFEF